MLTGDEIRALIRSRIVKLEKMLLNRDTEKVNWMTNEGRSTFGMISMKTTLQELLKDCENPMTRKELAERVI